MRHEVWQYTNQYGGWVKDRRTEVLDRILMAKSEFQRWTWVWEPRLGESKWARSPQPSRARCPRSTIRKRPKVGFQTERSAQTNARTIASTTRRETTYEIRHDLAHRVSMALVQS